MWLPVCGKATIKFFYPPFALSCLFLLFLDTLGLSIKINLYLAFISYDLKMICTFNQKCAVYFKHIPVRVKRRMAEWTTQCFSTTKRCATSWPLWKQSSSCDSDLDIVGILNSCHQYPGIILLLIKHRSKKKTKNRMPKPCFNSTDSSLNMLIGNNTGHNRSICSVKPHGGSKHYSESEIIKEF